MSNHGIYLVARHEFLETVRSKSFLISLFVIPLAFGFGLFISTWLQQQTTPTRIVAVVDLAGGYAERIERQVARHHARAALAQINAHVRAYAWPEFKTPRGLDPGQVPLLLLKGRDDISDAEADAYLDNGGPAWAMQLAMPFLRPDAPPPFVPPNPARIVPLPEDVAREISASDTAAILRPWLTGGRTVSVDGRAERVHAVIVVPPGTVPAAADTLSALGRGEPGTSVQIWSEGALPEALSATLPRALDDIFRRDALLMAAGDPAVLEADRAQAPLLRLDISAPAGREVTSADVIERILPRALSVLLIYFLFMNMFMLMSNTMEEKSNRIVEVLISSVTTDTLMVGKLLGSSLVALLMFAFSIAALGGILFMAGNGILFEFASILLDILRDSAILPALFVNFVLGYFLFAGVFLVLGAFADSSKDVQNLSTPVVIFMMTVPVLVWAFAEEPNGMAARVLSFMPFFGPFMMMARVNADPSTIEVVGSMAVQILTISGLLWGAGKVFRIAVLFSGRPNLARLFRLARSDG